MGYPQCDRAGCGTNACEGIGGQYGHGRTIDTGKPYRISHAQIMNGELMATSSHHFSQEGRTANFNACNQPSMGYIGYDLHDIVAVFSLWPMGCDATWLDGCTGATIVATLPLHPSPLATLSSPTPGTQT